MTRPGTAADAQEVVSHPEEMRGSFSLRIGDQTILQGSGRTTPAGVISAGLALAAVAVAFGFVVKAARSPPRRLRP